METKEVEDGRHRSQVHHQGAETSAATRTTRQIRASHRLPVRPHALRILLERDALVPQLLLLFPIKSGLSLTVRVACILLELVSMPATLGGLGISIHVRRATLACKVVNVDVPSMKQRPYG